MRTNLCYDSSPLFEYLRMYLTIAAAQECSVVAPQPPCIKGHQSLGGVARMALSRGIPQRSTTRPVHAHYHTVPYQTSRRPTSLLCMCTSMTRIRLYFVSHESVHVELPVLCRYSMRFCRHNIFCDVLYFGLVGHDS